MRFTTSRDGTLRPRVNPIRLACALVLPLGLGVCVTDSARAAWITGAFPAIVYAATDPNDLLGLGPDIAAGDALVVSIFIDTAWIDFSGTATGAGALSVTITDSNTGRTALFTDTGDPAGLYGTGSFFIPNTGTYYIEGHGGQLVSILLTLSLDDEAVVAGVVEQRLMVSPGSGSGGTLEAYLTDSLTASIGFDLAQGDVDVPEPAGVGLLAAGILGLAGWRLRRPQLPRRHTS